MGFTFRKQKKSKGRGSNETSPHHDPQSIHPSKVPPGKAKRKFSLRGRNGRQQDGPKMLSTEANTASATSNQSSSKLPVHERPLITKPEESNIFFDEEPDEPALQPLVELSLEINSKENPQLATPSTTDLWEELNVIADSPAGEESLEVFLGSSGEIPAQESNQLGELAQHVVEDCISTQRAPSPQFAAAVTKERSAAIPAIVTPDAMSKTSAEPTSTAAAQTPQQQEEEIQEVEDDEVTHTKVTVSSNSEAPFEQDGASIGGEDSKIRDTVPLSEQRATDISKKLLEVFSCNRDSASVMVQEIRKHITSPPCGVVETEPATKAMHVAQKVKCYNDSFAVKFLNEMLNEGFTLVYHLPPQGTNGEDAEDQDWVGRSVTMMLQPGVCNADKVVQPKLVWKTMGGGLSLMIDIRSVGLLNIHSITSSGEDEMRDDRNAGDVVQEEMNCFFTLTSTDGDVHVFESITSEEGERLVRGIKNLTARLSNQLISGDTNAFSEFYSNMGETDEIRFSMDEAMVRLSHSFFDF